jgi:DNA-binding Lrp family transcriptional regulator
MSEQQNQQGPTRTLTEELELAGKDLIERVKELIEEGNVRRIVIRNAEGRSLIELPLTPGVLVGSVIAILNPWLALLGFAGGVVAKLKVEVIREVDEEVPPSVDGDAKG